LTVPPRHLPRDRNADYGRDFRHHAGRIGIDAIATLDVRAKGKIAVAERVDRALRARVSTT
jgi:hypothetical protein